MGNSNIIALEDRFFVTIKQSFSDACCYARTFQKELSKMGVDATLSGSIAFTTPRDRLIRRPTGKKD